MDVQQCEVGPTLPQLTIIFIIDHFLNEMIYCLVYKMSANSEKYSDIQFTVTED